MLSQKQLFFIEKKFTDYLISHFKTNVERATNEQLYYALSSVVNDLIYDKINNSILSNSTLYNERKDYQNNLDDIVKEKNYLDNNINNEDKISQNVKNNENYIKNKNIDKLIHNNDTFYEKNIQNRIEIIQKLQKINNLSQNLQNKNINSDNKIENEISHKNLKARFESFNKDEILLHNSTELSSILKLQEIGLNKIKSKKTVHYLSIEFLIGKSLKNNLWCLKIEKYFRDFFREFNKDIEDIYDVEQDAGLGNGGLGRLAACFLESLAQCGYSAFGHCIKYEYGLFKQKIINGKQQQFPDEWIDTGRVWLNERNDKSVEISIGGNLIEHYSEKSGLSYELINQTTIVAVPFDYTVLAFDLDNTSTLRLWEARAKDGIDLHLFDLGEYDSSLRENTKISSINKILYPNDNSSSGKELRLIQQYFLVSAVVQSVLRDYFEEIVNQNINEFEKESELSIKNENCQIISLSENNSGLDSPFYRDYIVNKHLSENNVFVASDINDYKFSEKANLKIIEILKRKSLKSSRDNIEKFKSIIKNNSVLNELSKKISLHINDTHPALCVPELMRVLIDDYHYGWEESWAVLEKTISYTNHTILAESLEIKKLSTIEKLMPRIALILKEINRRFNEELKDFYRDNLDKIDSLSIISRDNVYMANLAVCSSHKVNGVSKIHSEILKSKLFKDYDYMFVDKFLNVTNGISFRRWLYQSNKELTSYIRSLIGDEFLYDANKLKVLESYENDESVLFEIGQIKYYNKIRFAEYVKNYCNIEIDPSFRFDIQAKRIHEYKRQLMNILKVIYLADYIKKNPHIEHTKQVFIFAGKSASSYKIAKRIIELIVCVSKEIEQDEFLKDRLKVVFLENYNVSMAEIMMTATDVSEQISVAGREASGTGNMKAVLNGSLMICTTDGANIEICDKCGHSNMFEFGLKSYEVERFTRCGYNAMEFYEQSEKIRTVLTKMKNGIAGENFDDLVNYLLGRSGQRDVYMCLADFESYIDAHFEMDRIYRDKKEWNRRVLHSIANMGYFSSDRSIKEYALKIWNL